MTDTELQKIIAWIDASLEVFRGNQGKLSVPEIQMWSMLTVVRKELVSELSRVIADDTKPVA